MPRIVGIRRDARTQRDKSRLFSRLIAFHVERAAGLLPRGGAPDRRVLARPRMLAEALTTAERLPDAEEGFWKRCVEGYRLKRSHPEKLIAGCSAVTPGR